MKRSLGHFGVWALLLVLATAAAAETGDASALKTFMASDRYIGLLNRAFASMDPQVFQRCPALVSTSSNTLVISPVTLRSDGVPASGSWRQSFPVSGCSNDTTLHIFFNALGDGRINTVIGVPGASHADGVLQRDAFKYVGIAVRAIQRDCTSLSVKTTSFEGNDLRYPPVLYLSSDHPSPAWWEMWTVVGCGHTWEVPVDFIPDATGTQIYQPSHIVER